MKLDANKVLGLPGVGPKAMQNIEEQLAAVKFPEPEPAGEVPSRKLRKRLQLKLCPLKSASRSQERDEKASD